MLLTAKVDCSDAIRDGDDLYSRRYVPHGIGPAYPEEAPVHRVTVDGFWMDRTPVTNRQFKEFVKATGHVTFAELTPDPKNYPGILPHMIYAGSLTFTPPIVRSICATTASGGRS